MTVPDWHTFHGGARVRVALWLHSEVGEGGTFTKAHLRDAFPKVEQIDRRMRDLRPEGWIFATYREDRSLSVDELRFVSEGGTVWERGYRSRQTGAVSDKQRQAAFAADNYSCTRCGVSGGETYADDPLRTAQLTLARRSGSDGGAVMLQTVCDRCHVALRDGGEADELLPELGRLTTDQLARFRTWVDRGSRQQSAEELLWSRFVRLPHGMREELRAKIDAGGPFL